MPTGHAIAMSLRAAYLAMHRQTDAHVARLGVTADQFVVLTVLAERDGITQQELVRRTGSDPNTIRAMLMLLEKRGLVSRQPHPTDGRARIVTLTPRGRQTSTRLWVESEPVRQRMRALFSSDQTKALIDHLRRISEALGRSECNRGRSRRTSARAAR